MRKGLTLFVITFVAACSSSDNAKLGSPDSGSTNDAASNVEPGEDVSIVSMLDMSEPPDLTASDVATPDMSNDMAVPDSGSDLGHDMPGDLGDDVGQADMFDMAPDVGDDMAPDVGDLPTATFATASLTATSSIVVEFDRSMDTTTLTLGGELVDALHTATWSTTNFADDTLTITPQGYWYAGEMQSLTVSAEEPGTAAVASASADFDVPMPLIFYTSESGPGDLSQWTSAQGNTGIDAGDAVCAAAATSAGLAGTFVAVLSDSNHDAYCRMHGLTGTKATNCGQATLPDDHGPWFGLDGTPRLARADLLFDPNNIAAYSPISTDENGVRMQRTVFTGSVPSGEGVGIDCDDWTDTAMNATIGINTSVGRFWIRSAFNASCSMARHLTCAEVQIGGDVRFNPPVGKMMFVTEDEGTGLIGAAGGWANAGAATGVAAADAICQAEGEAEFGVGSTYIAMVSTGTEDLVDRITSDGPYVRPDGFEIAANKAELFGPRAAFTPNQLASGIYVSNAGWGGTSFDGSADSHCQSWLSEDVGEEGRVISGVGVSTFPFSYFPCDTPLRLLCVEQ